VPEADPLAHLPVPPNTAIASSSTRSTGSYKRGRPLTLAGSLGVAQRHERADGAEHTGQIVGTVGVPGETGARSG